MKNTLPNKLSYGDETSSGSGLMETKLVVNQLIDYLAELTEVMRCCNNGYFESEHNCQKQPPTLKKTLMGEIKDLRKFDLESLSLAKDVYDYHYNKALSDVKAIINQLMP